MPYGYGASQARYTGLMNRKKKPSFFGETFGNQPFYSPPPGGLGIGGEFGADQGGAGVGLSGTGRWGSDIKGKKGPDFEGMMEALAEHESAKPAGWASMGKPGGTGGGGFKLSPNSMVENMASSGPLDLEKQKRDWWERYLRSIA
jgi:hypothetical protein